MTWYTMLDPTIEQAVIIFAKIEEISPSNTMVHVLDDKMLDKIQICTVSSQTNDSLCKN